MAWSYYYVTSAPHAIPCLLPTAMQSICARKCKMLDKSHINLRTHMFRSGTAEQHKDASNKLRDLFDLKC